MGLYATAVGAGTLFLPITVADNNLFNGYSSKRHKVNGQSSSGQLFRSTEEFSQDAGRE